MKLLATVLHFSLLPLLSLAVPVNQPFENAVCNPSKFYCAADIPTTSWPTNIPLSKRNNVADFFLCGKDSDGNPEIQYVGNCDEVYHDTNEAYACDIAENNEIRCKARGVVKAGLEIWIEDDGAGERDSSMPEHLPAVPE